MYRQQPPIPTLAQQTVLITGAAQGLGRAIAQAFAHTGARLILVDSGADRLQETAASLPRTSAYIADLSDETTTRSVIHAIRAEHGAVHTLIHNAGFLVPQSFAEMRDERWRVTFNVGIQAAWLITKAFWHEWQQTGAAAVYVSSRSGIEGFADEAPYCATKHAIEGLVKALAIEGAAHGILLHTVTPGRPMRTPMSEQNYTAELRREWVDPSALTPAFLYLAERRDPSLSGQRLSAWDLSHQVEAMAREGAARTEE